MSGAGREPLHADCSTDIEAIAEAYLRENDGNPSRALRCIIGDALADLLECERRSRRAERLLSRGNVRGRVREGREQ
jgi:hypothetical protein